MLLELRAQIETTDLNADNVGHVLAEGLERADADAVDDLIRGVVLREAPHRRVPETLKLLCHFVLETENESQERLCNL